MLRSKLFSYISLSLGPRSPFFLIFSTTRKNWYQVLQSSNKRRQGRHRDNLTQPNPSLFQTLHMLLPQKDSRPTGTQSCSSITYFFIYQFSCQARYCNSILYKLSLQLSLPSLCLRIHFSAQMDRFSLVLVWSLCLSLCMFSTPTSAQLKTNFYANICPNVESIVKSAVTKKFQQTFVTVPATIRLFFHDCFVQVTRNSVETKRMLAFLRNQSKPELNLLYRAVMLQSQLPQVEATKLRKTTLIICHWPEMGSIL